MHKLCFYVPESHLEQVKDAVFEAGAGRIAHYDRCCWQMLGEGQFRPLPGSSPYLGKEKNIETVAEYRVEMVCDEAVVKDVVDALKKSHPYETPAFDLLTISAI